MASAVVARGTPTPSIAVRADVLIVEWAATCAAFGLWGILVQQSTPLILGERDRFQMSWIYTPSVPAEMVQDQSGWDWSHPEFVRNPMGVLQSLRRPENAVPIPATVGVPLPAVIESDHLDLVDEPADALQAAFG